MSEWNSVLAVYWVLWAVDGFRLAPQRLLTWCSGWRRPGGGLDFERIVWLGAWPGHWRLALADVPLALSPLGVTNRPAGAVGRPGDVPAVALAYRWEEVREVGVAQGWVFVNGKRFYPDTGHLTAPQLLALAQLAPSAREGAIRARLRLWLRPAQIRRRERVLRGRTRTLVTLNVLSLSNMGALTVYLMAGGAAMVSDELARTLAVWILYLVGAWAALHVAAVVVGLRAVRRLKVAMARPDKRRSAITSALVFPPQALRVRAMVAEGFFPVQHPLAVALALAKAGERERWVFNALADLRWPIDGRDDPALAREVVGWYRAALGEALRPVLAAAGIETEALLGVPRANSRASCTYCPRCRDQFTAGREVCPHGVKLEAVGR